MEHPNAILIVLDAELSVTVSWEDFNSDPLPCFSEPVKG